MKAFTRFFRILSLAALPFFFAALTCPAICQGQSRTVRQKYMGVWRIAFSKKNDTCLTVTIPPALNAILSVDSKLNATDRIDRSLFFRGRATSDSINFSREREALGCRQLQSVKIKNVRKNRAVASLKNITDCYNFACEVEYQGRALKK